ncbi:response regulator [Jeotgalibaca caeni]|uniref:response regulator n=1 Tax=Jeotgalibaca caeni TaxID=3028623 RepID=UPI00237DDB69|nr:response regulator [Jeotgalibaca caeni]MDE1548117.1 response regulator [Jeotgalibaca caeni]
MQKVIVVDDEVFIANSIATLIQRSAENIHVEKVLYSSEDALQYIQNHDVDIMITDIQMPGLNGLELIEQVHACNPFVQMIIITGYGTFEYAKQAMALGVKFIFQKPVKAKELMAAIDQVVLASKHDQQAFSLLKSERLNEYLLKDHQPMPDIPDGFSLFMIDMLHFDTFDPLFRDTFASSTILSGTIRSYRYYLIPETEDSDLIHEWNLEEGLLLYRHHCSMNELKEIIEYGERMLNLQFYYMEFQLMEIKAHNYRPVTEYKKRFEAFSNQMIASLEEGSIAHSKEILYAFFLDNKKHNHPKEVAILESHHLISKLIIHFQLQIIDEITQINENISLAVYYQDVVKQFETILERVKLEENDETAEQDLAAEINTVIEEHYSNPDLSLTWISKNLLFFNAEYLGREFSQRVGKKFNTKLTEYRIEQAKKLLLKSYKVYEVAKMVGYENNPEYFNLVFKKHVGTTPLKYSKLNQKAMQTN